MIIWVKGEKNTKKLMLYFSIL